MSAAKRRKTKNANRRVSQLARLLSLLFGPARTLTLLVLLLALFWYSRAAQQIIFFGLRKRLSWAFLVLFLFGGSLYLGAWL